MSSILNTLPRPAIFAHRGSSAYRAENTISSFLLAVEQQADAIELDVQLTADKHVVAFHDPVVDRLTDGTGWVKDLSIHDLRKLTINAAPPLPAKTEKIPTLQEVFGAVGDQTFYNIELKNFSFQIRELPQRVIDDIKTFNLESRVLISSFNPLMVKYVNRSEVPFVTGLLIKYIHRFPLFLKPYASLVDHQSIHLPYGSVTRETVKDLRQAGKVVYIYTLNDPLHIRQAVRWGIDGFFTDDPLTARRVVDQED